MTAEQEQKIKVGFQLLNEFIYSVDNLPKWVSYIEKIEQVTITNEIKGSYITIYIKLFGKVQPFNFRVIEFEKNKKVKLKSFSPYFFEITLRTFESVDGLSYVVLKTKVKPRGLFKIFYSFNRKKLTVKNQLSLDILGELFAFPTQAFA